MTEHQDGNSAGDRPDPYRGASDPSESSTPSNQPAPYGDPREEHNDAQGGRRRNHDDQPTPRDDAPDPSVDPRREPGERSGSRGGDDWGLSGDRPEPYGGRWGEFGGPSGGPRGEYGDRAGAFGDAHAGYGERAGAYRGVFGASPSAYQPGPPKQVTVAAVISLGLGALCVLLAGMLLTSAGAQIAEIVTGSADSDGLVAGVVLASAVAYIVPAIFLLKRRPWARYVLIAVAAIGIAGGVMSLPAGVLGLAIHATLFVLMLHNATKLWFRHR